MAPAKNLTTDRLDALRHKLLAMLATVEQAIDSCIEAYCQRDEARAWTVASHDHAINEMETCIDEMGMRLLAREGPLAQDLRTVLATMRIANDIERMADEAANIAERTMPLVALPPLPFDDDFKAYVPLVRNMVHQAVQCVVDMDADLARSLAELDEGSTPSTATSRKTNRHSAFTRHPALYDNCADDTQHDSQHETASDTHVPKPFLFAMNFPAAAHSLREFTSVFSKKCLMWRVHSAHAA